MQLEHAQMILEEIEGLDIGECLYEDYSGRGMYGKTTAAVVADQAFTVFEAIGRLKERGELPDTLKAQVDSLGRGYVIY